jgi:hypothetical protein
LRKVARHDGAFAAGNHHLQTSFPGVDRLLPAGAYEVITDEEMIEGCHSPRFVILSMVSAAASRLNDGDDFHQFDCSLRRAAH